MFNTQKFCIPPSLHLYFFAWISEQAATVRSESRCALRLRYVDLVVSTEVAVAVCCCFNEIFRNRPSRPCGPPTFLYKGYRVFPGGKAAGVYRWPPTPSSAELTCTPPLDLRGLLQGDLYPTTPEHKIYPKCPNSVPCCTIPTVHFPSLYLFHIPMFLPCYHPIFTGRTSGHSLTTFRAVNFSYPLTLRRYKCGGSYCIPVSSSSSPSNFFHASER
jgi:hypothetical protein